MWAGFLSSHHGKDEVQELFENLFKQGTSDNEAHGQAYSEITKILACPVGVDHIPNVLPAFNVFSNP